MSRSKPGSEPANRSFSRLLETLTQEPSKSPQQRRERPAQPAIARPSLPKRDTDARPLSYEQALQRHARIKAVSAAVTPDLKLASPKVRPSASPERLENPSRSGVTPPPPIASPRTNAPQKPASKSRRKHSVHQTSLSPQMETPAKAKPSDFPQPKGSNGARKKSTKASVAIEAVNVPQVLQRASSPLDSKSVMLSVRLTEPELELLRLRAAECGVSVSGYMRSCVLEADQLRTQVKHALAEMRAATRSQERPHEAERLLAADLTPNLSQATAGGWRRFLVRSSEFLFGNWRLRREAPMPPSRSWRIAD